MPRQPFAPLYMKNPMGAIQIGTPALGQRPEIEALICKCLMAWPIAESEMGLLFGQLLGIGNEAALAVFHTLRRYSAQREPIEAAAKAKAADLGSANLELITALLDVHKSTEAERTALAHGHFGIYDLLPDVILWMTATDYTQIKAKIPVSHANTIHDNNLREDLVSRASYYKKDDLQKIYDAIIFCTDMWDAAVTYLRSHGPQRDQLYRQLCDQPRIAQALDILRRKNTPPIPA